MAETRDSTPQPGPADLISVREAAQAVGVTPATVQAWIARGKLTAYPHAHGYQVSLATARTLLALPDPQTPADARPIREVAQQAGVPRSTVHRWARRGLLPTWPSLRGRLVRMSDVQTLDAARAESSLPPYTPTPSPNPVPPDALPVWQVSRQTGLPRGKMHHWAKRGTLPSWPSRYGKLVRVADVLALAAQHGLISTADEESTPR